MKCKDFERNIYLYTELTEAERTQTDSHIRECVACKELFQCVSAVHALVTHASQVKPELVNHGRLTSNIMQAVARQQTQPASWINRLFFKYTMVAVSLALVIAFGIEQSTPVEMPGKRTPTAEMVPLPSVSLSKIFRDRKEKVPATKPSLYACAKSGACDNPLIESFKKKSL
jgi:anti-sigma factor RsiW